MRKSLLAGAAAVSLIWSPYTKAQEADPSLIEVTDADDEVINEIIVTATKRAERVRDISGSITAFDERALEEIGARSYADYLTRTPGVVFNQTVPGNSPAIIRGVATTTSIAQAQGTTGYFINDVPLTDPFYSGGIPDIDTFDVENIAILRGPQGTLFGSASMGGAINYKAAAPDLNSFGAHLRGTVEDVRHGENGLGGHIMLNAPIIDGVLAIRGVYGQRRLAGFVDNIGTGLSDTNRTPIKGGRLLMTMAPSATTTVNYLFLEQTQRTDDAGSTEPGLGAFAKSTLIPESFRYRTTIHNLRLDQDLGFAMLTATATHHAKAFAGQQDYSGLVPTLAPAAFLEPGKIRGETFELRLASNSTGRLDYLFGIFHDSTREYIINQLDAPAATSIFGTPTLIDALVRVRGRESALFGEASYSFTDKLKATLGGRLFRTRLLTETTQGGPLSGPTTTTNGTSSETGFSPKVSLTWQPNDDYLVYALASRGFRFGGPNIARDPVFAIPSEFGSDSLWNYEIGARTTQFDGALQLDATLYWIDWSDIQVTQRSPSGFIYTANAGRARNRGFEASATYRPVRELTFQVAATYLDGRLRRAFGAGAGLVPAGTQLPGASRWQLSDSIIYRPTSAAVSPTIALSHRYTSEAPGELIPTPRTQGGYHLFDMRVGATFAGFGVSVFVENIVDTRGVSQSTTGIRGPVEFLVRPRTVGLTLDYKL